MSDVVVRGGVGVLRCANANATDSPADTPDILTFMYRPIWQMWNQERSLFSVHLSAIAGTA